MNCVPVNDARGVNVEAPGMELGRLAFICVEWGVGCGPNGAYLNRWRRRSFGRHEVMSEAALFLNICRHYPGAKARGVVPAPMPRKLAISRSSGRIRDAGRWRESKTECKGCTCK